MRPARTRAPGAQLSADGIVVSAPAEASPAAPEAEEPARRVRLVRPEGAVAELCRISKHYGRTPVFDGLDASFEAGTLHAVTGPSGSGKTTLLHMLAGLELPSLGEVAVLGTAVSALDRAARAAFRREHVALVRQEVGLVPFLSARENVELGLALRGIAREEATRRALEALDSVGLTERAEQRVLRLSAGERGRVAIARALAARPALLLGDEPSSRLDQANALAVAAPLRELAREAGAAVICATHDPLVIEQADRELALRDGSLVAAAAAASG